MDTRRFDALARALRPANRRSLLGGAIAGVLGITSLVLGQDEVSGAKNHNNNNNNNQRRRQRRNRKRTSRFLASPLSHTNETPASSGDSHASTQSKAAIQIVQRRRRFQICGNFTYITSAVQERNVSVRDVAIQYGNTGHTNTPVFTFPGWTGSFTNQAPCRRVDRRTARQILRDPNSYFVNIRTYTPNHQNGAVAARLLRQ
jgi:hypothetical protein